MASAMGAEHKRPRARKSIAHLPSASMDKENMTTDLGSLGTTSFDDMAKASKRARSKSIGPGDVARLLEANPAIRNLRTPIQVRSILKPTLPVSPLRELSAAGSRLNTAGSRSTPGSPLKNGNKQRASPSKAPAQTGETVSLRTEDEQQAAVAEREKREAERKDILDRREARRKSMANRRVSFAPEATLHEWNPDKYNDDSTSSSASTESSRRASSVFQGSPARDDIDSDPPSTPQKEDDHTGTESPAHQRDLHKKRRRRSSTVPPMNFNNPSDEIFSSPMSLDSNEDDAFGSPNGSSHSSESDDESASGDGTTMMSIDDVTAHSVMSSRSPSGTNSSEQLNAALRQAAHEAGKEELSADTEDQTMDLADDDVTAAFQPFARQAPSPVQEEDDDDMSMDVTRAIGGIITAENPRSATQRRQSVKSDRLSGSDGDATMDLTMPVGGIAAPSEADADEELTMEFTTAVGGLLGGRSLVETSTDDQTMDMDMTAAIGGILSKAANSSPAAEQTTIVKETPVKRMSLSKADAREMLKAELDHGEIGTPEVVRVARTPAKSPARSPARSLLKSATTSTPKRTSLVATSETGSPSLIGSAQRRSLRNGTGLHLSSTPVSAGKRPSSVSNSTSKRTPQTLAAASTPTESPNTPTKQITPVAPRPRTPSKLSVPLSISFRSASPKKLFVEEAKSGKLVPAVSIPPQSRRSSGVGIDREGLGSPGMAAKLDRRRSIGDTAPVFALNAIGNSPQRRFEKPLALEAEIEKEAAAELAATKDAAPDVDATLNLKEMIESMTPRKPIKGRKSLALGGGKALLGKRTFDESDEDSANEDRKRSKKEAASPVKSAAPAASPSKGQSGRSTRSARKSLGETDGNAVVVSPSKAVKSPVRATAVIPAVGTPSKVGAEQALSIDVETEAELQGEQIHLQEFLNLTSIRFMELNTTKRRQTVGPAALLEGGAALDRQDENSQTSTAESLAVSGVSTIPQLELFQHSCRELKRYIAEGREVVKEIEADTFEENPPLFREYINAPPDVRFIMDNQFKNVKTNARLLSKAMWYEWRMKLLDGLQTGLQNIRSGLESDAMQVTAQTDIIGKSAQLVTIENEQLIKEEAVLQEQATELASCDQTALKEARERLLIVDEQIAAKTALLAARQAQLQESNTNVEQMQQRRQQCLTDIADGEKIREECRGWTAVEVRNHQSAARELEAKHGWMITGVDGTNLTMTFRSQLELCFDSRWCGHSSETAPPTVRYLASETADAQPTEQIAFFVDSLMKQLSKIDQASITIKGLLEQIGSFWTKAELVMEESRLLHTQFYTTAIKGANCLTLRSVVFLGQIKTKAFATVNIGVSENGDITLTPEMKLVYGERFNEPKMGQFLQTRISPVLEVYVKTDCGSWRDALSELAQRLVAQKRK